MAQFQVPQFIETEPKIVGPLTIKQFGYIGIAGMLSFFLFFTLRLEIWLVLTVIMGLIACAFAFLKYNGRPFEVLFINAALYIWKPKLYLWQRKDAVASLPSVPQIPTAPSSSTSKIKTLWLSMITRQPTGAPVNGVGPSPAPTPVKQPIVHPLEKGAVGSGGTQMLRDLRQRKRDQGY